MRSVILFVGEETTEVGKIREHLDELDVLFKEVEHDLTNQNITKLGVYNSPTVMLMHSSEQSLSNADEMRLVGFDKDVLDIIARKYKESIKSEWDKAHYEFSLHKKRTGEENWYLLSHLKWGTGENYLERNWRMFQEQRKKEKRREEFLKLKAEGKI